METLEQAAVLYAPDYENMLPQDITITHLNREAFKSGAEWQKEQYNTLQSLLCTALPILTHTGYTDLATKLENELERLQD